MNEMDYGYIAGRLLAGPIIVFAIGYAWQRLSKKRQLTKKELITLAVVSVGIGLLLTVLVAINKVGQQL